MASTISKKRKFVADGIFKAELDEFLRRELAEDGYSGVEVRMAPTKTEIIILATRTQSVLGEKGRRIRELTSVIQKRFGFNEGTVEVCILTACDVIMANNSSCKRHDSDVRRESPRPRLMCYCPVRIASVQTDRRPRCQEGLLWCPAIHHGVRGQGMRSRRFRKASWSKS